MIHQVRKKHLNADDDPVDVLTYPQLHAVADCCLRLAKVERWTQTDKHRGFVFEVWEARASCSSTQVCFFTIRYASKAKGYTMHRHSREFADVDSAVQYVRQRIDRWWRLRDLVAKRDREAYAIWAKDVGLPPEVS